MKPEEKIGTLLREKGYRLAVAESCTGGLIGHRITNVPGSSTYYMGSITAYAYDAKVRLTGVRWETLEKFGAVSEQVVAEMATGVRKSLSSDVGVAVSGIAGPGGGTEDKPVGTVCFAICDREGTLTFTEQFDGDRLAVKEQTADKALEALVNFLK